MPNQAARTIRQHGARDLVRGLALAAAVLLSACGGGGNAQGEVPYGDLRSYVAAEGLVGTIVVRKDGEDLMRASYGYADRAQQRPNDMQTRYRIASLTKSFTAVSTVLLKRAGAIDSYDDTFSRHLPDYPNGSAFTLRQLLTHTSGIPDYVGRVDSSEPHSPLDLMRAFENLPLVFAPGTDFLYSNANYVLLGHLTETLGGLSYAEFMQANVWRPLGLTDTEYGSPAPEGPAYALGYTDLAQSQRAREHDLSAAYAAGGLVSTADDLMRWAASFTEGGLLTADELAEVFGDERYGFGWVTGELAGKPVFGHTGGIDGFSAILALFPEQNAVIVVLSNVEHQQDRLERIVRTIAAHEF